MADFPVFTYQTRIHLQPPQNEALEAYAELYGKAERTLFAATQTGIDAMDLKKQILLLEVHGIDAGLRGRKQRALSLPIQLRVSFQRLILRRLKMDAGLIGEDRQISHAVRPSLSSHDWLPSRRVEHEHTSTQSPHADRVLCPRPFLPFPSPLSCVPGRQAQPLHTQSQIARPKQTMSPPSTSAALSGTTPRSALPIRPVASSYDSHACLFRLIYAPSLFHHLSPPLSPHLTRP